MRKNLSRFHKLIPRFKNSKVLVIGDIMLDRFIWGTVSRISPEAPVPVVWTKSESFMAGGASNVAKNIHTLGGKAYICGIVGGDEEGRIILSELANNSIGTEGIVVDSNRPTVHKTRIIAHHQQVVRIDKESETPIAARSISRIIAYAKHKVSEVDAIIIEDYGKGLVVPRLIKELINIAKQSKKIITVDPKQNHLNLYKGVTAITPNRKEAGYATGIEIKSPASLNAGGNKILKRLKCEAALITLGEDGMALFTKKNKPVRIPTVAQEVYDVSGAGDTVIAAFTLAMASGSSMVDAAHLSNIAAGVVVGKLGIASCSTKELKSHLRQIKRYGIKQKKSSYPTDSIFKQ